VLAWAGLGEHGGGGKFGLWWSRTGCPRLGGGLHGGEVVGGMLVDVIGGGVGCFMPAGV
jgi:hypothetical protein